MRQAGEGLREILKAINSNRTIQEILDLIVLRANQLLNPDSTIIRQLFREEEKVRTVASLGLPPDFDPVWQTRLRWRLRMPA